MFLRLLVVVLFAAAAGRVCAAGEIRMGTANGAISQAALTGLREAYRRIGIDIAAVAMPADQALRESSSGQLDGEAARVAGLEARFPNLVRIPVAVVTVDAMVFANRTPLVPTGWGSLKPYHIGILKGVQYAAEGTRGMRVDAFADNAELFGSLERAEIDFAVATRIEGVLMMRELRTRKVAMLEPPLTSVVLYHYLHASHRGLVPKITASLQAMEREGRMRHIMRQTLARMLAEAPTKRRQTDHR
jgi:polar amino acid transport system substrate-binding protein